MSGGMAWTLAVCGLSYLGIGVWGLAVPIRDAANRRGIAVVERSIREGSAGDVAEAVALTFGPLVWPLMLLWPVLLAARWCWRSTALIGGAVVYRVRHESSRRLDRKREAGLLTIVDDAQTGGR